jgi:hypothetical protein
MTHDPSDDEIWSGLRRRFAAGERLISRPALPRDHPQEARPARRSTRLRTAGVGSLVAVGAVIVLVAVVLGTGSRQPATQPSGTRASSSASAMPTPTATPDQTLTATQDGLSLTATVARATVEPGGTVRIEVTIHNGRTTPITFIGPCDGFVNLGASLPLPLEPVGESWTGVQAHFKADALGHGNVPGESNDSIAPVSTYSCNGSSHQQTIYDVPYSPRTLDPGQTVASTLIWPAEFVTGVPALPGDVPFTIWLVGTPPYASPYAGTDIKFALMDPPGDQLQVSGHIHIVGETPKLLSKGQAVDAALADPTFAKWLLEQPESTWSDINLILENDGGTSGASWMLEVFRENGVPRNLAIAFIDPFTGEVRLDVCESPCSR